MNASSSTPRSSSPTKPVLALSLLIGLAALMPAEATVLRDDTFADGTRTGWYTSRPGSDLTASSDDGGKMVATVGGTSHQIVTYFTDTANPVSLEVGETLQITTVLTFEGLSSSLNAFLRVGVFNSGGARITSDEHTTLSDTFRLYRGYGPFGSRPAGINRLAKRTGNSVALLVDGTPWTMVETIPTAYSLTNNTEYTLLMKLTRTNESEMLVNTTVTIDGNSFPITFTDTSSPFTTFDTFAIAMGGASSPSSYLDSFTVHSMRVEVIPEPTSLTLLGLAGGSLLFAGVRKIKKD